MNASASYISVVTASAESLVGDPLTSEKRSNAGTPTQRSTRAFWNQIGILTGYAAMFLLCVMLITYMRVKRHDAFKGNANAARKIILPAFEPLLWILAITTGLYSLFFCITLATNYYDSDICKRDIEVFYSGRQFVFVIVIVFMMQKSVSLPALRRTVLISLALATYTVPIVWVLTAYYEPSSPELFWGQTLSRALLQLFFLYVFIWPPGRANRTPLRHFCIFVFIYFGLGLMTLLLTYLGLENYSVAIGYIVIAWASLCPLHIWRVLKADTEFWRGMGQRACSLQHMARQHAQMDERISSRGLHLLIEMHRKYIIDFAYLELKRKIGVGANSAVFNGILHSKTPVAAKVYTPRSFTEDTIATFSHEAALCATLHHPNVVQFFGMCICPPTVCLVFELCLGNLEDVMIALAKRRLPPPRQQEIINVGYMLDAARALAYIHSFSPPFLHRDVKPANFLVDACSNVKLTDFGESRSLPRQRLAELTGAPSVRETVVAMAPMLKMTVTGTVDYMPPEMIRGRSGLASYGEAADVYSLAITFWDILNPGRDRYPRQRSNPMLIFETVVDGTRPDLDIPMHPRLRELIANAWQSEPSLRPTARHIVALLESIQEELLASFAAELCEDFERTGLPNRSPGPCHERYFTGEYAIERMEDAKYVLTAGEGVRLGNALMDSGFLHHLSHEQGFEDSDEMYFFDEDNVKFCQPLAILEAEATEGSDGSALSDTDLRSFESGSLSSARKLSVVSTPKRILSQFTASIASSGRSISKSSIFSSGSDATSMTAGTSSGGCQCRRLAQRLEPLSRQTRKRHHRSHPPRRKFAPILEEDNALGHKLLDETDNEDDEDGLTPSSSHEGRSGSTGESAVVGFGGISAGSSGGSSPFCTISISAA